MTQQVDTFFHFVAVGQDVVETVCDSYELQTTYFVGKSVICITKRFQMNLYIHKRSFGDSLHELRFKIKYRK